jgi:hypothetical protein
VTVNLGVTAEALGLTTSSAAGIKPGDERLIELVGEGKLRLRTSCQAIETAQSIVARRVPKSLDLVAELITERREEPGRE